MYFSEGGGRESRHGKIIFERPCRLEYLGAVMVTQTSRV